MGNVLPVEIVETGSHLSEPEFRLLFRYDAVPLDEVQEIAIVRVTHEDEDSRAALQYTVHLQFVSVGSSFVSRTHNKRVALLE